VTAPRCPSHPSQPLDDCGYCEAKIRRRELDLSDPPDDGGDVDADRYERWVRGGGEDRHD